MRFVGIGMVLDLKGELLVIDSGVCREDVEALAGFQRRVDHGLLGLRLASLDLELVTHVAALLHPSIIHCMILVDMFALVKAGRAGHC